MPPATAATTTTTPPKPPVSQKRVVLNNEERVHRIQLRGQLEHNGSLRPGPLLELKPGVNLVDNERWELAKQNPQVTRLLEERIPPMKAPEMNQERVGQVILVEGALVDPGNPLAAMPEGKAVDFATECLDLRLLKSMLATEERLAVRSAISANIKKLDPKAK